MDAMEAKGSRERSRSRLRLKKEFSEQISRLRRAWIGKVIRFRLQAHRMTPRLPHGALNVVKIAREKEFVIFFLRAHNQIAGEGRHGAGLFRDRLLMGANPDTRYECTTVSDVDLDMEAFVSAWSPNSSSWSTAAMTESPSQVHRHKLSEILPLFQLRKRPSNLMITSETHNSPRAQLQMYIACDLPYRLCDIYRAHCSEATFQTTDACVLQKAQELQARENYLYHVFRNAIPCEKIGALRVGSVNLWPWQAAVGAHIYHLCSQRDPVALVREVRSAEGGQTSGACGAEGIAHLSRPFCVVQAAPGKGKTFTGALAAKGRFAVCLATASCVRQWETEASRLGLQALYIGAGGENLQRARRGLVTAPHQLWVIPRSFARFHATRLATDQNFMPQPQVLILDEIHVVDAAVEACLAAWPSVPIVGLTGTNTSKSFSHLALLARMDQRIANATIIRVPDSVHTGRFPSVHFHIQEISMTPLEAAAYAAGEGWMQTEHLLRLLIVPPDTLASRERDT